MKPTTKLIVALIGILVLLTIIVCVSQQPANQKTAESVYVTLDGSDPATGVVEVPVINIWDTPSMSKVVIRQPHGAKVELLSRDGKLVQVKTLDGVTGWLSASLVRELR